MTAYSMVLFCFKYAADMLLQKSRHHCNKLLRVNILFDIPLWLTGHLDG